MKIKTIIVLFFIFSITACVYNTKDSNYLKTTDEIIKVYPQLGHSDIISTVIFTPGDKFIVSGSYDTTVRLWDFNTGREKETFLGHKEPISALAASPKGNYIASCDKDGVIIWNIKTGKEFAFLPEQDTVSMSFNHDETIIYTASAEGIKEWYIKEKKEKIIKEDLISIASFSKKNKYIAFLSNELNVFNIDKNAEKIINNNTMINTLSFNKEETMLAAGSTDGYVFLYDDLDRINMKSLRRPHTGIINTIKISDNNRFLATASTDKTISLFDLQSNQSHENLTGHTSNINSIAFSSDEAFLVSASSDNSIIIWDTAAGKILRIITDYSDIPLSSDISSDCQYIATYSQNDLIRIWDAKTGQLTKWQFEIKKAETIAFSSDNKYIISLSKDGTVRFYSIETGIEYNKFSSNAGIDAMAISFDFNKNYITSAIVDGKINLINILNINTNEETILKLQAPEDKINTISTSPNKRYVAAGFNSGNITITNITSGKTKILVKNNKAVKTLQFSKDSKKLIYGTEDGIINLININNGKNLIPEIRHQFSISSLSFSADADSKWIISSSLDNTTVLWNAKTGEKIASFIAFNDGEWITITPDGYYTSSPRGDEWLNVRIGDGIYGMDQFRSMFSHEEVVESRLIGNEKDPNIVSIVGELQMKLVPPSVTVKPMRESGGGTEKIEITVKDEFHQLRNIQVIINGRLLGEDELQKLLPIKSSFNLTAQNSAIIVNGYYKEVSGTYSEPKHSDVSSNEKEICFSLPVNLETGDNYIQVIAKNIYADSEGRNDTYINNNFKTTSYPVDLWVLIIGVNNYTYGNPDKNLRFSVKNAETVKQTFENQIGKRYRNVYTRIIADNDDKEIVPTKENIIENLNDFFVFAKSNDVLAVYFSGHGMNTGGRYLFLPQDFYAKDGTPDYSKAVSLDDIKFLMNFHGRKIIFIDSCYSGGIDPGRIVKSLKNQSTAIFASSQDNQLSWEGDERIGYGIFTRSLILGIHGDKILSEEIRLSELNTYVYNSVTNLSSIAGKIQHPYIYIPKGLNDFIFAITAPQL